MKFEIDTANLSDTDYDILAAIVQRGVKDGLYVPLRQPYETEGNVPEPEPEPSEAKKAADRVTKSASKLTDKEASAVAVSDAQKPLQNDEMADAYAAAKEKVAQAVAAETQAVADKLPSTVTDDLIGGDDESYTLSDVIAWATKLTAADRRDELFTVLQEVGAPRVRALTPEQFAPFVNKIKSLPGVDDD